MENAVKSGRHKWASALESAVQLARPCPGRISCSEQRKSAVSTSPAPAGFATASEKRDHKLKCHPAPDERMSRSQVRQEADAIEAIVFRWLATSEERAAGEALQHSGQEDTATPGGSKKKKREKLLAVFR
jgi:hypothetical protein